MMDYREIFEDTLSEICEKAPFSDDEQLFDIVKERANNMEKKKFKIRKPTVIAASIAAAAALTASVGAATNWDINSLFGNYNNTRQTLSSEEKSLTKWYLERDMYDTESSELYKKTDNYDNILSKIVHPVDKLCEYDKANIYISGYAYDGYIVELYYDVTPKKRSSIHKDEETYTQTSFYSYVEPADKSMGGSSLCYATEGNTKKCMSRFHYRLPDDVNGSLYLLMPDDLDVETQMTYEELESRYLDYAFMIEKPDIPEYVYEQSLNLYIETTDGKQANVEYLLISPISIEFGGKMCDDLADYKSIYPTPLYIEYDDGEVLDLSSWTSTMFEFGAGQFNGEPGFYKYVDTNGNILDITHIKNIRLFDKTIEIKQ